MKTQYDANKLKIKLGYMPTRRNSGLSKAEAARQKQLIYDHIKSHYPDLELVDLHELNDEGILLKPTEAEQAADIFIKNKVDALFAPHCNFGCEDGVAKVGKLVNKPLLLWGPRDEAADSEGFRLRDSQCGMFATSKSLLRFGVKFTYITNSELESDTFRTGFEDFLATVRVVKAFSHARIGQIGVRPTPFASVMTNESELVAKFGIEVVPYSVAEISRDANALIQAEDAEYVEELAELRSEFVDVSGCEGALEKSAALAVAIRRWAVLWKIDAIAIQCWSSLQASMGIFPCVASARLTEQGLPVSCETDVNGAVTLLLLRAASGGGVAALADLTVRHPTDDNTELLWHCGNYPPCLSKGARELTTKGKHPEGIACNWEIRGGHITVARFDGIAGKYSLLMGEAEGTDGPVNKGTYLWAKFHDWKTWENRFIHGPYIHHVGLVHGKYAKVLYAASRYIDGLDPDPVYPDKDMLEQSLIY